MSDLGMTDLVLMAVVVAFFAASLAYIAWCDRIAGEDDEAAR